MDTTNLKNVNGQAAVSDFHQNLFSRYLFDTGSWYSGDGAPQWLVAAGDYAAEDCGVCILRGQNITQNVAVRQAVDDFWNNRKLDFWNNRKLDFWNNRKLGFRNNRKLSGGATAASGVRPIVMPGNSR